MSKPVIPKLSTVQSTKSKETIYVDIDDEITSIISKVANAKGSIIALVLPKRASVLQSIVNMKLLKRSADDAHKNLVLITSEASLLPIAALVGLHVADSPTSKPIIPEQPIVPSDETENIDEPAASESDEDFDAGAVGGMAIGTLASRAAGGDAPETLMLDDDEPAEDSAALAGAAEATPIKKNKKLVVPSFNAFRTKLLLGGFALIALIALWCVAMVVLPKATVAISTDSSTVTSNLNTTFDTTAQKVDVVNKIIPAIAQTSQKTQTQQVPTTGQVNNGEKATGTVKFTAQVCTPPLNQAPSSIPTGSGVSSGGITYITQSAGTYQFKTLGATCATYATDNIPITALKGGANANTSSGATFSGPNGASGTGTASGGTDQIVKVVAQVDIDSAKNKIAALDNTSVHQDLANGLKAKGVTPADVTFLAGAPQITTSANVGDAADTVTVTANTPFSMLGFKTTDLRQLIEANVYSQIDKSKQKISDDGIGSAQYSEQNPGTATSAVVLIKVKSIAGPSFNVTDLKNQTAGKKAGEIQDNLRQYPGVTDVRVQYSPFWVSTVPKDPKKITIKIDGRVRS